LNMADDDDHEGWVDSWYAWLVIVPSTFAVAFSVMGVQYCAGVINSAVVDAFEESAGRSAWVTALGIGFLLLSMGPAGTIQARIGFRFTIIIGGVLAVAGLFVSVAATEIWHLYLSYGVLAATGQGFAYLGAVSTVQVWFSPKHRAMASAVASAGSGLGTVCLGLITEKLIDEYSWKTGFYFCAIVSTVGIFVPAIVLTSPPVHPTEAAKEKPPPPTFMEVATSPGLPYFCLCLFVFGFGGWNPIVHNGELYDQHGFDSTKASNCISVSFGIGSVLGRPVAAKIMEFTGRRQGFPGILAIMAVVTFLNPVMGGDKSAEMSNSMGLIWVGINNALYGFAFGAFISVLPPITAELVGMARFPQAIGLVYASFGISMMVGPPMCGYWAGNSTPTDYDASYYASGGAILLGAIMSVFTVLYDNQLAPPPVVEAVIEAENADEVHTEAVTAKV